jgi:SOS response regulatory protein OraA/RecX
MNRNMVLYLAPESAPIASAVEQAIEWLAAQNVLSDDELMERFSETQRRTVEDRAQGGENGAKDHVRKAWQAQKLAPTPC